MGQNRKIIILLLIVWFTNLDIFYLNQRRSFYSYPFLGKIFENKFVLVANKAQDFIFRFLNSNRYIFSSHPRENVVYE